MIVKKAFTVLMSAAIAICMVARPASAQITTGSVAGSVKDAQGGVIPGATVILINEAQGTKTAPAVTNDVGDFVFPNVPAGTYTVEVSMPSFKTYKRTGVSVGAGNRATVGSVTLDVGGATETVEVKAAAPLIQATTGERSFTITTESVENLPLANRSFTALTSLAPGVTGNNRIGGGGGNNIMLDGVSAVDTGSNAILLQMNVESIAEVKVLTSGYQAEYGRSSGLQVTATTKSGTNRFKGSVYDVERDSDWYANSKTNILNGTAKNTLRERDFGYSIGGPIGKPGRSNKLFFFYSHEYAPRTAGGSLNDFRVPTQAERNGDFSQTLDNNGNLYNLIKDPQSSSPCTAANNAGCFQDGGVLGKIPANRFYSLGQAILNQYPMPNISGAGLGYNYETTQANEKALAWQPAVRVDYQPSTNLRMTYKYSGWKQTTKSFAGTMPTITQSDQYKPIVSTTAITANYTLNPSTFVEATFGHSQNELAGCGLAQGGTGPTYCTSGIPTAALSNRVNAGLGALPMLFPDALKLNTNYYAYQVLSDMAPPMFQDGQVLKTPNFTFGGRVGNSPPNSPFSGFLNKNSTYDISTSLTKVAGHHTFKGGFYNTHSWKAQQQNSGATFGTYNFQNSTANPLDSTYPYANALLGIVTSFNQLSTYIEGTYVYNNTEGYIQDNWKVSRKFTLDYGIRFVHQQPQYDSLGQASNFLPEKYAIGQAPTLYIAGCANNATTCTGTNRSAINPITGQNLGVGTTSFVGTIVQGTGNSLNGLFLSGQGIADTTYTWPTMGYAPRVGGAYDVSGNQKFVLRGGVGLYFDRPSGNSIYAQVTNPPAVKNITVSNASLASLGTGVQGAPALNVFEYAGGLPSSVQWNVGTQMTLPWSSSLDLSYVGQHAWNQYGGLAINNIDFGAAFLPANQDLTQAPTTLGSNTVTNDQMRAIKGYGSISQQNSRGWNTYHSFQVSVQRRFTRGISLGFNDSISISNVGNTGARLQHAADGTYTYRADQAQADALLGDQNGSIHSLKANFVWDMPDLKSENGTLKAIGYVVNDWQLSGIWTGSTGSPYTVGFSYQNGGGNANLTGSPDYGARIRIVGDQGSGCNGSDPYRQFNVGAFNGPLVNSVGLESGTNYLHGCFQSVLDLSIARNIRLSGGKNIQLRVDMFNAPNQAIITNRATNLSLSSPSDPVTNQAPIFDPTTGLLNNGVNLLPNGSLSPNRSQPKNTTFGGVTAYQNPRTVQMQIRFSF